MNDHSVNTPFTGKGTVGLFLISIVSFFIIQLPPGDYLTSWIAELEATGEQVGQDQIAALRWE